MQAAREPKEVFPNADHSQTILRPITEEQREPEELEILRGFRTWDMPEGTPDQAWRVTVWPQWGYKNFMANHVYVHRYGDQLWTARSTWQSGPPHFLWLLNDELTDEE
jgi:hypothetical protein